MESWSAGIMQCPVGCGIARLLASIEEELDVGAGGSEDVSDGGNPRHALVEERHQK